MPQTKDEEAKELARKHFEVEAGLTHVFRIDGSASAAGGASEPIMLLEVNENTVPSGILPLQFGPSPASGIHYSSVIVEVTPDEFDQIRKGVLKLPAGWEVGEEIPRPCQEASR